MNNTTNNKQIQAVNKMINTNLKIIANNARLTAYNKSKADREAKMSKAQIEAFDRAEDIAFDLNQEGVW